MYSIVIMINNTVLLILKPAKRVELKNSHQKENIL